MPVFAILNESRLVTNRIVADSAPTEAVSVEETDETFAIGGTIDQDGTYKPPIFPDLPSVPTPNSVTPKQARIALAQAGLLAQVNAMVRGADEVTQITWDYALTINRTDPLILQLATALNPPLTEAEIDALFIAAAQIP